MDSQLHAQTAGTMMRFLIPTLTTAIAQILISNFLGYNSTCTYDMDTWASDCEDSSYQLNATSGDSFNEECTSHSEDNMYSEICASSDGSSSTYDWSWDENTNKSNTEDCNTSPDGNTCCEYCTVYYNDDEGKWIEDCEESEGCPENRDENH